MDITSAHCWAINEIGARGRPYRVGTAGTHGDAWIEALAAARAALLAGELTTLAVTVDDTEPTAFYTPAHNPDGSLDPASVTADLVELHQAGAAEDIARRIVGAGAGDR